MKKAKKSPQKFSFENFQNVALNSNQKKKLKGGSDVVTEDLAEI